MVSVRSDYPHRYETRVIPEGRELEGTAAPSQCSNEVHDLVLDGEVLPQLQEAGLDTPLSIDAKRPSGRRCLADGDPVAQKGSARGALPEKTGGILGSDMAGTERPSTLSKVRRYALLWALETIGVRRRRIVAWRAMAGSGVCDVTFERDGMVWTTSPDDESIGFPLFTDGGHHMQEVGALLAWMLRCGMLSESRNVVVDVGANIGSTCIPIVRAAGCRALAIEPAAENFRRLMMNVAANGLADRILLAPKAVLRTPGTVKMCLTERASGGNFVWRDGVEDMAQVDVAGVEDVEADALTSIIASVGLCDEQIALVWADVQGCEADVVESAAHLWELGVPLWAEVEPHSLARQGSLARFADVTGAHFDRFIDTRNLIRFGEAACPVPIAELKSLIAGITPEQVNTDVLFLPPRFDTPTARAPRSGP
jgi:FkbM family methyltransferase